MIHSLISSLKPDVFFLEVINLSVSIVQASFVIATQNEIDTEYLKVQSQERGILPAPRVYINSERRINPIDHLSLFDTEEDMLVYLNIIIIKIQW